MPSVFFGSFFFQHLTSLLARPLDGPPKNPRNPDSNMGIGGLADGEFSYSKFSTRECRVWRLSWENRCSDVGC